ncbi:sugar phosphate isomerase/epimerase family protein [Cohnella yongneupensis]|uniref:Sugar phosphate isomerase/epimerase family protein n=1 Tax=Cohnella yongneupensis TaxID=425006 RepID=A0ABW0QXB5_9BACL
MSKIPVAIQPYTVRDHLSKDYKGTLTKIAEIGYRGIELGPPPKGMTIAEQKSLLDQLGLKVIGFHSGLNELESNPDEIVDYLEEVNAEKYVALSLGFESKEDLLIKAAKLNKIGARLNQRGVQLLYHNHDWEFNKFDGVYALDLLRQETDPSFVKFELDTYWVKRGGQDPAGYLGGFFDRCPLLHIKDVEAGEEQFFAEIGEGILDFNAIAHAAEKAGTKWFIVEQDSCRRDALESIAISYRNLQMLGFI